MQFYYFLNIRLVRTLSHIDNKRGAKVTLNKCLAKYNKIHQFIHLTDNVCIYLSFSLYNLVILVIFKTASCSYLLKSLLSSLLNWEKNDK